MTQIPATATIADAARLLNVSTKTLRRWEARGVLVPERSEGGHRRYNLNQIRELKGNKKKLRISSPQPSVLEPVALNPKDIPVLYERLHIDQRRVLRFTAAALVTIVLVFAAVKFTPEGVVDGVKTKVLGLNVSKDVNQASGDENKKAGAVLAAATGDQKPSFNINIESAFKDNALFTKDVQIDGDLTLQGQIIGNVDTTGVVIIGGNSITSGQTTFNLLNTGTTTLNVGGAATAVNIGATTGTTTVNNNLQVDGAATVTGAGTIGGNLSVTGNASITGTGTVTGKLTASGDLSVGGNTEISGTGKVTGKLTASGDLSVGGNSVVSGTETVSGKITGSGDLAISGNATFGNITSIKGITYSFPTAQGAATTYLTNDGSGNLTWTTSGSSLPTLTAGSVVFSDGTTLAQDNSNFYWDDSNNRLGIGNSAPTVALDVTGAGRFSSTLTASNGFTLTTGALNLTSTSGTSSLTSTATSGDSFAFTNTSLTANNSNAMLLTYQNANTGAGTLVNGLRIVATGSTPSSGTNTENLISLSASTLGSNTFNGIYFNTGLTNYVNSTNWVVTAAGAQTIASDLAVNGGNITTTQTTANLFNDTATTLNIGGAATSLNLGATTGTTTIANSVALGNATTDEITFTGRVAADSDLLPVGATGTNDLGSALLPWDNVYAVSFTQNGNLVCDASGSNCPAAGSGGSKWKLANGDISPFSDTLDVLIGSSATASAKFAFKNVASGVPTASISGTTTNVATFLTGEGNLATTNNANLTIGGSSTGNIILNPNNAAAGGYIAPNTNNVTDLGTSSLNWRNVYATTVAATTLTQGGNGVCDSTGANCPTGAAGGSKWKLSNGAISPFTDALDVLIGNSATTSAKFAFKNVNSGVPTASISGTTTNVATYLDGNGNLSTTNMADLTLGSSSTGNVVVNSRGSTAITVNGTGSTFAGTLTASNGLTLTTGALNLTSTSGTSSLTSTATSGDSFAFTNNSLAAADATLTNLTLKNNNTGAGLSVNGLKISATGSTPSGGTNTANLIDLSASTLANNTFNGINFGSGLTNYINGTNFTVTAAGNVSALGGLTVSGGTVNLNFTGTSNTNIGNTTGTTTVAGNILPATTNTTSLGSSSSLQLATVYANSFVQNGNNVCDSAGNNCPTGVAGGTKWKLASGAISPFSDTLDVLIGSSATTSAKFAFKNVATGTPTASISGTTANVATYLTGEGNLATTNMADLTLGGSTTGQVVLNSRNNSTLIANGTAVTVAGDLNSSATSANLFNTTTTTLSMGGAATTLNLATGNTAGTFNFGTGTGGNTFNIGTNNSTKDTLNLGSALDDVIINGAGTGSLINFANFDVATSGNITVAGSQGLDVNAAGTLFLGNTTATAIGIGGTASTLFSIGDGGSLTRTFNIGTGTGVDTINLGTGATGADVIAIGGGAGTLAINTGDWDVSTTGDMTGIGGITADGTIAFTGTTIGLGTSNSVTTFNVGTGTAGNTFNIATDNTTLDTLNIGSALDNVIINGAGAGSLVNFANFDVATTGNVTVAAGQGIDANAAGALAVGDTTATTVSIGSTAATTLNLGAGGALTRTINIGTGTGADTINIGTGGTGADTINIGTSASTTALNFTSGTGAQTFASSVATGTTSSSAFVFTGNSLTTGTGMYLNSSTITTGTLLAINATSTTLTTGKLFDVQNNSSSVFNIGASQITSALPHQFTAAGDVVMAYDLVFTNQTASTIDSYGPLTVRSGESFESNNLTLKTYNSGNIIFDTATAGKVLVGTGSATLKFTVSDSQQATASAMIENMYNGSDADALAIKLGYTGNGATTNRFITFLNGVGNTVGRVEATTGLGVAYQTAGIDFAEYFTKDTSVSFEEGDIVSLKESAAVKSTQENDSGMIGIVSTSPGFKGGNEGPDKVLVGLVGQVPLKISSTSEPIKTGDLITSSSEAGKGKKANGPGFIIGKALESWNGQDKIMVYVSPSWADPNMNLTSNGNLKVIGDANNPGYFTLADLNGNKVEKLSLTNLITQMFESVQGSVDNLLVKVGLISPEVLTKDIKPLAGEKNINITLGTATESGNLAIKDVNGTTVTTIDSNGDATFSGQINSENASISGALYANTIYADQIISKDGKFGDLSTNTLGGITREEIENLLESVEQNQNLQAQALNWSTNTATASASLNELSLKDLYVTGVAAFESLSVQNNVVFGGELAISKLEVDDASVLTLDTLDSPLSIQSAASQPLYIMAGKVKVDTTGDVQILGNLAVGGVLSASAINIAEDPNATASGAVLNSQATAGTASIASQSAELTIVNPNIKEDSLIFVTPTSKASEILYIKSKTDGNAVVGFTNPTELEVTFNWWIVNQINGGQ